LSGRSSAAVARPEKSPSATGSALPAGEVVLGSASFAENIFRAKFGGTSIAMVFIGTLLCPSGTGTSCDTWVTRSSSARLFPVGGSLVATPAGGAVARPGNVLREASDITDSPVVASNRVIRLIWRGGPPTSSQGSQKLYEWPSFDLL